MTLLIISSLIAIFIHQLDLNDYLQTLEDQLSDNLQQPVAIKEIHLAFEQGLAIELKQLVIGDPLSPLLEVPSLTATLKLIPLFERKLLFTRVLIDSPSVQLFLPLGKGPAAGSSQQLIDSLGIRILTIRNARLNIFQQQPEGPRKLLQLDNLHSVLTGWETGKSGRLVVTGQYFQKQHASDFTVDLSLPTSTDPSEWREENFRYRLTLQNFATADLPKPSGARIPKQVDLYVTLDGVPAKGTQLKARLFSHRDQEELFSFSGNWQSTSKQDTITALTGSLLGLPIDGELLLLRQPKETFLGGRFGAQNVSLTSQLLRQWRIPGAEKLKQGELDRLAVVLVKSWQADETLPELPRIGLELSLTNLDWNSSELQQLQDFSVELLLQDENLLIKDGLASISSHPVHFSGQLKALFSHPQLDLKLLFEPDLKRLEEQLTLPEDWRLNGPIPIELKLSGALNEPSYSLSADLSATSVQLGKLLQKIPEHQGRLFLSGQLNKDYLQLDEFQFTLGDFLLSGEGNFPRRPETDSLLLDIDAFDLAKLQPFSPLFEQLQIVGRVHPYLEYTKGTGARGRLRIDGLGSHFFNIVGDLNQAQGEIHFNHQGLSFSQLEAALGESPVTLSGRMTPWQEPRLELAITGPKVRAVDLIFRNQDLNFYHLDGRLQIDKQGIAFAPVKVALETETQATVSGQLTNFKQPEIVLDISAEKADIIEVIKVFQGPPRTKSPAAKRERKPILINVYAKQGTLGGLSFQNAQGQIKDHRGVFTIYPLNFENDGGYCVARVEFDRNRQPGILKVSGHAEDIDASILHQSIFKRRGLISGKLRGDFYLEGATADNRFWHNATGGIHLQVSAGTLRKFRGLARVFSLLNISQIFAGNLPDMDNEGMPFSLLEGSVGFADGRMSTEDLHVESEAMNLSLVGEQNLIANTVNFDLGVMPLRTVDKVVSKIPIAGWILAGEEKALFTAHFKIKGSSDSPKVTAIPIGSVSNTVFGIVKRTFGLPGKLVKDLSELLNNPRQKQNQLEPPEPQVEP